VTAILNVDRSLLSSLGFQIGPVKKERTGVLENFCVGFKNNVLVSELTRNSKQLSSAGKIVIRSSILRYKSLVADAVPRYVPKKLKDRVISFGFKPDSGILTNLKNFRRARKKLFSLQYKPLIAFTRMPSFAFITSVKLISLVRDTCNLKLPNSTIIGLNVKKMFHCFYPLIGNTKSQSIRDFSFYLVCNCAEIGKRAEIRGVVGL
jgi:hypothetical protein